MALVHGPVGASNSDADSSVSVAVAECVSRVPKGAQLATSGSVSMFRLSVSYSQALVKR